MMKHAVPLAALLTILAGCAQFTTNASEGAALQSAAAQARQAYQRCLLDEAQRYEQTGESASLIVEAAKKACTSQRQTFADADLRYLKTKIMITNPVVARNLAEVESGAVDRINTQVLERKAAASAAPASAAPVSSAPLSGTPAATPMPVPAAVPAAVPVAAATPVAPAAAATSPASGQAYLDCMRAEGQRYAKVNEPAQVVAEVAHSRCAASLQGNPSAAQLEQQGRTLVMGMVLDAKAAGAP